MRVANALRESGRAGSVGASEEVAVGVAMVVVDAGTAAEEVAPAPARSHGLGGLAIQAAENLYPSMVARFTMALVKPDPSQSLSSCPPLRDMGCAESASGRSAQ